MNRLINNIVMITLLSVLGACASINSLTRAKNLKAGTHELYAGIEYSNLLRKMDGGDTDTNTFGVDVAGRYGITDQDEVGVKLANTLAYFGADYKRGLITGDFNVSAGAAVGYLKYTVGSNSFSQIDMGIPVYVDYEASEELVFFASPKFQYSLVSGDNASSFSSLVLSAGARLGQESGVHFEFGYGIPFNKGADGMWQANAGIYF